MMKIKLSEQNGPYSATLDTEVMKVALDTEVMKVEITEAFIGPTFIGPNDEQLAVIMRDSGFELNYSGPGGLDLDWNAPTIEFKNGRIIVGGDTVWSVSGGADEEAPKDRG